MPIIEDCLSCGEPFDITDDEVCPTCGAPLQREDNDEIEEDEEGVWDEWDHDEWNQNL